MNNELLLHAIVFAADKHKFQRRKGSLDIPYINHPLKVCHLLAECGEQNMDVLLAAILHDVIEDTNTSENELSVLYGHSVLSMVLEVTDEKNLPEAERKQLQIIKAPTLSDGAKKIKIADKICNLQDIINYPLDWEISRKLAYACWAKKVVNGCRGLVKPLDDLFDKVYEDAIKAFS
jgi:GTP diphosphokinase / guanosine-3',5'-bis(diphosphate) 3'-diphosphatase